jgi:hypothetical protein
MKRFLLIGAMAAFAMSATTGLMLARPPAQAPRVPDIVSMDVGRDIQDAAMFYSNTGVGAQVITITNGTMHNVVLLESSSSSSSSTIQSIASSPYVVTIGNGIIDQNCIPRRDPKELMASNESLNQLADRMSRPERLAANPE